MQKKNRNPALVAAMARCGHTGKTLAYAAGLCQLSVSKLVNSKSVPTQRTANAIATVLGCEPRQLGWEEFAYDRKRWAKRSQEVNHE